VASTSAETKRHLELDGLRGFAVMGILAMNIVGFAMPFMAYMSPAVYGGTDPADLWAWFIAYVLFDGKMRGLFSLLFGASIMLIITRAEEKGANPAATHYSRMAWLAVFGLLHFFFIWVGDILFLYAVAGSIVFLFRRLEPQRLIVLALVVYAAYFIMFTLVMGSIYMLEGVANAPNAGAEAVRQYQETIASFGAGSDDTAEQLAVHQGSWAGIVADKFENELFYPLSLVVSNIGETVPLMLLGTAFYKTGFLLGEKPVTTYRNWAILGLGLGGASFVVIGLYVWSTGFDLLDTMNAALAWTIPGRLLMTIGYASALVLLIQRFAHSGFIARVAATGRAAFTNYLGTSIAMTTIFYGYGLGLFGEVGRAELYLFVIGAWIVMLLWSKPWLTRYRYGPFEWLWRSLARRQLQPMRRLNAPV
jgi:uncharacterized protein